MEFEKENGEKIKFVGKNKKTLIKVISAMMATKYLRKRYVVYLAFVIEDKKGGLKLKELPVVNEFQNIFLEYLPGLPPQREIEYEIERISKTAPIS